MDQRLDSLINPDERSKAERWRKMQRAEELARKEIGEANRRAEYKEADYRAEQWDAYKRGMTSSPLGQRLEKIMECEDKDHPFYQATDAVYGTCFCGELKYLADGQVLENFVIELRQKRNRSKILRQEPYGDADKYVQGLREEWKVEDYRKIIGGFTA